jgi:hypothetical protein
VLLALIFVVGVCSLTVGRLVVPSLQKRQKVSGESFDSGEASDSAGTQKKPKVAESANIIGADAADGGAGGRRQRAARPHDAAEGVKANPFFKEQQEWEKKQQEKQKLIEEARKQKEERRKKQKDRNKQRGKLIQRTKSGQPIMKNMINHILGKVQKSFADERQQQQQSVSGEGHDSSE